MSINLLDNHMDLLAKWSFILDTTFTVISENANSQEASWFFANLSFEVSEVWDENKPDYYCQYDEFAD